MADPRHRQGLRDFLLGASLLLALPLFLVVPLHVQLLVLTGILFMLRRLRRHEDPDVRHTRWVQAALGLAALSGAYAWTTPGLLCPFLTLCLGPLPLGLLALAAFLHFGSSDRQPLGRAAKGLVAGLLLLATLTSLLALGWLWLIEPSAPSPPLTLAAVATDTGVEWLPAWLYRTTPDTSPLSLALAAWTAFLGGWLALSAGKTARRIASRRPVVMLWFGVWAFLVLVNAAVFFAGAFQVTRLQVSCTESTATLVTHLEDARRVARHARHLGLAAWESRLLAHGLAVGQCGLKTAEALPMAARLATLNTHSPQSLLPLADLLSRLKEEEQVFRLFDEEALSEERLRQVVPSNLHEAWVLSTLWRERNHIDTVRDVLRPYVQLPASFDHAALSSGEPYPMWVRVLRRYGDYCLFSGDLACVDEITEAVLSVSDRDLHALTLAGEAAYSRDDIQTALRHIYLAYRQQPYDPRVVDNLIAIYVFLGNVDGIHPLERRVRTNFPEAAWQGKQKSRLYLPGTAYLQGELLPGRMHLEFAAKATPAGGEWPLMEVWVNGKKVGQATAESEEPRLYAFEFITRPGPNRIEVRYLNDAGSTAEEDRNLHLGPGILYPVYYEGQKR